MADDPSVSDDLAQAVSPSQVRALLIARAPGAIPDDNSDDLVSFEFNRQMIVAEVEPLVGDVEHDSRRWALGVTAVAVGTAAALEASLFPEQQGLGTAGDSLRAWYERLLGRLQGSLGDEDSGSTSVAVPRGDFPDAVSYPDPARVAPLPYGYQSW